MSKGRRTRDRSRWSHILPRIECQCSIALHKRPDFLQAAGSFRQLFSPGMFEDQEISAKVTQCRVVQIIAIVWRIDKADLDGRVDCIEALRQVHLQYPKPVFYFQRIQVLPNHLTRFPGLLHEINKRRATADRFDANSAHSRTAVKECRTIDTGAKDVEDRFPELVACWAKTFGGRTL